MTLLTNLTNAGLPISAASEDGNEITWITPPLPSDEQMQQCRVIVMQYVDLTAYGQYQRKVNAKPTAKAIPNWASWTQQEWNTYFTDNLSDAQVDLVTTLATARVMMKRQNQVIQNLVKLIITFRDEIWPDLPDP